MCFKTQGLARENPPTSQMRILRHAQIHTASKWPSLDLNPEPQVLASTCSCRLRKIRPSAQAASEDSRFRWFQSGPAFLSSEARGHQHLTELKAAPSKIAGNPSAPAVDFHSTRFPVTTARNDPRLCMAANLLPCLLCPATLLPWLSPLPVPPNLTPSSPGHHKTKQQRSSQSRPRGQH